MEGTLIRDRQRDTLLYAGQLKVRITDWFFLKDKADLKYIGLENATVKMSRTDSVWNYQFLLDYFRSPATTKKKGGIVLNLKKLDLKQVHFVQNDRWAGKKLQVSVASVTLDAETIDLPNNRYVINEVKLDEPYFSTQGMTPLRPDSLIRHYQQGADTGMYFNQGNMRLQAGLVTINNGNLFLDSDNGVPVPHFDGSHIRLSKLKGTLKNISFIKDTLRANIDLAVKERSGLELKKLKANFKLTPQIMELANLDLQTNRSHLTNYYAMKFKDFNRDFAHYISKVTMEARFRNAKVNSDDIAYFAPDLKTWKKETVISGNFLGTVENFSVQNLSANIGATTNINGRLTMKGLPEINTTKISLENGSLKTNYYDLGVFVPALKDVNSPNLPALGTIIYKGNFNGTINNFVTAGTFSTQLGGVKTNVSLSLPKNGDPTYTGNIETSRFNLGKFLNNEDIGLVDFKGKISGNNFTIDKLRTTLEGSISSLEYKQYTYTNIVTNGTFQKKYFIGEIKIDDPNLDFNSTVEIDLTDSLPRFNIVGDFIHSNLTALNIWKGSKDSVKITGLLDANFTGTNIDNFQGSAKFLNANIKSGAVELGFDSLALVSSYNDTAKSLHLASDDFNAHISGQFNIESLPASFQSFLSRYYPTYIKAPKTVPENQRFSFSVNTNYIEPYFQLINTPLSGFNDVSISGSINTLTNSLNVLANVPFGKYNKLSISNVELAGKGNRDTLSLTGTIGSVQATDSIRFPNTRLNIVSYQDHSEVSIKTSADNTLNDADLYADVYTLSDGVRVELRPSSFVLNNKKWAIDKAGELIVRTHFVQAQNIRFTQGFQEITVETSEEDGGNTQNLNVKLKNVIMGDLTSLFMKNPRLEGITSGNIVMNDFFGQFNAVADLQAEQFRLDDDSIGLVKIKANYDSKTGNIPFTIISPNEGYRFNAKGSYNAKDTTGLSLNTDLQLENSKVDILHKFLSNIFTDIKGQATGTLNISGNINTPDLLGHIKLRNASMKVNYTQVAYSIDSADINFEKDGIDFGRFRIRDRYNNTGMVGGKLYERGFQNMRFDFDLKTDKLLLLDTRASDNQQFYGKAIGKVTNLSLTGPESNCRLTIVAEANDSSHLFIPNSISRESGEADFIVFKQYGTEMLQHSGSSGLDMTVDLDLTVNNNVKIDVILDEMYGDAIRAVGNGRMQIHVGTTEPLNMRGRYNIDSGSYVFNFQNLIHKPFVLLPEAGNYIVWTGDPFNADLHIDAQYTAERVSLSELVGNNFTDNPAIRGYRGDVYVIAQLREKLSRPNIKFKLDFPQTSPIKSDNDFAQYLNRLEKDQNQILNQVAYVLLFNSFAPPNAASGTAAINPYSVTYNTISQLITKGMNKVFSDIIYKITGDKSLRFDVGTSIYSSASILDPTNTNNSNRIDRTRVDLKLTRAFANDKIVVTLGTDIDFNVGSSAIQNGNLQWLPNVNIEFILTQDKKLRLIVFNRSSLDLTGTSFGRRNRQGLSISYRKDFEKLFGTKEKEIEFKAPTDSTSGGGGK